MRGRCSARPRPGCCFSPEVLRRVACDAALVPHVLGTAGEGLDLGRVARLFTRAQRRRLWRRDRGCTYPGCTAPASWAKAHHVLHWVDGGRLRHRQRRVVVPAAPHLRARPAAVGGRAVTARRAGPVRDLGPQPRQLRPAPGTATTRTRRARPATTDPTTPPASWSPRSPAATTPTDDSPNTTSTRSPTPSTGPRGT